MTVLNEPSAHLRYTASVHTNLWLFPGDDRRDRSSSTQLDCLSWDSGSTLSSISHANPSDCLPPDRSLVSFAWFSLCWPPNKLEPCLTRVWFCCRWDEPEKAFAHCQAESLPELKSERWRGGGRGGGAREGEGSQGWGIAIGAVWLLPSLDGREEEEEAETIEGGSLLNIECVLKVSSMCVTIGILQAGAHSSSNV